MNDILGMPIAPSAGATRRTPATAMAPAPTDAAPAIAVRRPTALQILATIAVLAVAYFAKAIVLPIIAAIILSFLLRPPVRLLARARVPKALGALLVLGAILALASVAAVRLSGPAAVWVEKLPHSMDVARHRLAGWREPVDRVNAMAHQVSEMTAPASDAVHVEVQNDAWPKALLSGAQETVALAGATVVLLFFLLASGDGFLARIAQSFPRNRGGGGTEVVLGHRPDEDTDRLLHETEQRMAAYLWTITFINLGLGIAVGVALHLLGMPNPILWGALCFVLNFVPYIGNLVGIGLVALVALVSFDHAGRILAPPLAFTGLVMLEANVVTPYVLGRRFALSPIVILVWTLVCAWMWGIAGAFIAVPMLAFTKVLCERVESFAPLARAMEP